MITTLYNFAKLLEDDEDLKEAFQPWKNPFPSIDAKVVCASFKGKQFTGLDLEDFKSQNIDKYLFLDLHKGTNIVPTFKVTTGEKTFNKLKNCVKNYWKDKSYFVSDDLKKELVQFKFNKSYKYLFTISIDGKLLGEIDEFRDYFIDYSLDSYKNLTINGKKTESSNHGLCAVTNKEEDLYGFVNTLGFSVNAPSFNRGGFNPENAVNMFPVGSEALRIIIAGRILLDTHLSNIFYGYKKGTKTAYVKYAVIPHFVIQPDKETAEYIAQKFLNKAAFNADSKEGEGANGFIKDTETILKEIIADGDLKQNQIYYDILFFEQQQAQFKVHLELNDVLPSRIAKVLDAKENAEDRYKIYYMSKDGEIKKQKITLYRLREYFLTGEDKVQPAFNKLIQSIFTGQPYDDSKLINLVVNTWRSSFKKNYHDNKNVFNFLVKNTLGNLYFLNLLKIFKIDYIMSEETTTTEKQDAFSFIETHPAYFHKEYLKGAFIFGCLTARLLYNQSGNAFMKELYGLNIDKEIISKKFPKLISKLRQYEKEFPQLESAAMRFFANDEKVSKDEISFAFTMGLVLQKDFDHINNKNKDNNNSQKSENHE